MANPVVPWEIQSLVPDEDAPRITQNFQALTDWGTYEVIQTRHIQCLTFTCGAIAAAGIQDFAFTFTTPFPAGVTPNITLGFANPGAAVGGAATLTSEVFNLTNLGGTLRVFARAAVSAGHIANVQAIDPNFDTTT